MAMTYYDPIVGRNRFKPRYVWAFWTFWAGLVTGGILIGILA